MTTVRNLCVRARILAALVTCLLVISGATASNAASLRQQLAPTAVEQLAGLPHSTVGHLLQPERTASRLARADLLDRHGLTLAVLAAVAFLTATRRRRFAATGGCQSAHTRGAAPGHGRAPPTTS